MYEQNNDRFLFPIISGLLRPYRRPYPYGYGYGYGYGQRRRPCCNPYYRPYQKRPYNSYYNKPPYYYSEY